MCGILGCVSYDRDIPSEALTSALNRMQHRGPDDGGRQLLRYNDLPTSVFLGARRLAIQDLSPAGHQPMFDEHSGNYIVFNGEVYNFVELRHELEALGRRFYGGSDTEVVLKAYAEWGEACVGRFHGMFAFAVWDEQRKRLFAARDRMGEKPFYYYFQDGVFLFASELRSLIATGMIKRELNRVALSQYLLLGAAAEPETAIRGIRTLQPACWLSLEQQRTRIGSYWSLDQQIQDKARPVSEAQLRKQVGELVSESVISRTVSDVPVGVFLSGGIDSSALVSVLSQNGRRPSTFSLVFEERKDSEAQYSRLVAKHFATDHYELVMPDADALPVVSEAVAAMDRPTIDGVNTYVVSREARRHGFKVALSGVGSDEIFAGYSTFRSVPRLERAQWLSRVAPDSFWSGARGVLQGVFRGHRPQKLAALAAGDIHPYFVSRMLFSPEQALELLGVDGQNASAFPYWITPMLSGAESFDPVNRVSFLELRSYLLSTLVRDTDVMSMACGLEVRSPFLDHNLIEYLFTIAGDIKLRHRRTPKWLLVNSLPAPLPPEIVYRPKRGFGLPFDRWLRRELREPVLSVLLRDDLCSEVLCPSAVKRVWQDFESGYTNWSRPWALYVLKQWVEANLLG